MTGWQWHSTTRCSPHTRGWTVSPLELSRIIARVPRTRGDGPPRNSRPPGRCPVFPAHAGMDRIGCVHGQTRPCVPRTRGDGPESDGMVKQFIDVFPAHAGMDRSPVRPPVWPPRVPRTRGDGPVPRHLTMDKRIRVPRTRGDGPTHGQQPPFFQRCSPHTRGWTGRTGNTIDQPGVFPAHAGMDRGPSPIGLIPYRCSPHTRGWTVSRTP